MPPPIHRKKFREVGLHPTNNWSASKQTRNPGKICGGELRSHNDQIVPPDLPYEPAENLRRLVPNAARFERADHSHVFGNLAPIDAFALQEKKSGRESSS